MFELVIAIGQDCKKHKVLKRGSYAQICEETTKYESTNEIREKYVQEINEFLKDNPSTKKNDIVVIQTVEREQSFNNIRHRVLYKSDKKLFDKLIAIPEKNDPVFDKWSNFWKDLRYGIYTDQELQFEKTYIMDEKIEKIIRLFNMCKDRFNKLFQPGAGYLNVKKEIAEDINKYYQAAEIVLKAFENYIKIYRLSDKDVSNIFSDYLSLKNNKKHQVKKNYVLEKKHPITGYFDFEEMEVFDEGGDYGDKDQDYIYSKTYLLLKPYIEKRDINFLKQYLSDYPLNDLTQSELEEIQAVISSSDINIGELESDYAQLEIMDELGHYGEDIPDYMHSNDYILLKPYIDNGDSELLERYLEVYSPNSLTPEELEEIQSIIKGSKRR